MTIENSRIRGFVKVSVGLDLADERGYLFALNADGEILADRRVGMTREALTKALREFRGPGIRVVMEAGGHSQWVNRLVEEIGHEAVVANPRALPMINKGKKRKNDRLDAEGLAHWGLHDLYFLSPIKHRGEEAQVDLATLRSRDCLVRARTELVNHVRSTVKLFGERLTKCSTPAFHHKVREEIPQELRATLLPLLDLIGELTKKISRYDKMIEELSAKKYPQTERLRKIAGVGWITALAFVLTLEDPRRFRKSRQVGPFLGLVPGEHQSSESSPELRITKAGDQYLRRTLIQAAHYILGPFGEDSELRRHGEKLYERGGKKAKRRAVVAVARKLAVLLHRLWVSDQEYDPFYNQKRKAS